MTNRRWFVPFAHSILASVVFSFAVAACGADEQSSSPAAKPESPKTILSEVRFEQKLGQTLSLDTPFRDETGREIRLAECLEHDRPVILTLVYHECPMLCNQVMAGLITALKGLDFTPGKEFEVVILSIAPTETPEMAMKKKRGYLARYARDPDGRAWHFLTGTEDSIRRIADEVGYQYKYDPKSRQYAHASGIVVLTPAGVVSRYFFGIDYATRPLRLALIEAADRRIGSPVDQILLLCFHYDPSTGRYSLAVMRLLQIVACATALLLGLFIARSLRQERKEVLHGAE